MWDRGSLQLAVPAQPEYVLNLKVPTLRELTAALLADVTPSYRLTSKGRLADSLASSIDVTELLKPGAFEAIRALTTPRSKELLRELRKVNARGEPRDALADLAATWGGRVQRRHLRAADAGGAAGCEALVALGWAERGLEVSCRQCGVRTFVTFEEADAGGSCPGCKSAVGYTLGRSALEIVYRLNTVVDLASDQGVISHLLVLAALGQRSEHTSLFLGTELMLTDGLVEVDVFGVHAGHLVAGEAKSRAAEFDEEQVRRDVRLSAQLGVDCHVLAVPEPITADITDFAEREARRAKVQLIVLDRSSLRPEQAKPV